MININTIQAEGLTRSRFIALSAMNILNAGELITSSKAAATEAKRIYGRLDCRGLWRKVQADARRVIETCNREGISLEKPYKIIVDEHNGIAMLWTLDSRGDLFPATWVGPRNRR